MYVKYLFIQILLDYLLFSGVNYVDTATVTYQQAFLLVESGNQCFFNTDGAMHLQFSS